MEDQKQATPDDKGPTQAKAAKEKDLGNEAFQAGNFALAIEHFTNAIQLDPYNHVLFSNRSAAYASLKEYEKALADADKTVNLKPSWIKGYTRKATAHFFLGQYTEAADSYVAGMEYEPNSDVLREGLQGVIEEVEAKEVVDENLPAREPPTTPPSIHKGVWVPMIVPYTLKNKINWIAVDQLVEYHISKGVNGILVHSLSGEVFELSQEERIHFARRVVKAAKGRVSVVAVGNVGASIEDLATAVKNMYNTGVDAVAVMVSLLAKQSDTEETWKENCKCLLERTGSIPLGLYECSRHYPRVLTPDTLAWAAKTGRFHFLFDNSNGQQAIHDKVSAVREVPDFRVYTTSMSTVLYSMQLGTAGFCDIAANVYPDMLVWMHANFGPKPQQAGVIHRFLTLAGVTLEQKYPQSAKICLRLFEKGFKHVEIVARATQFDFNEEDIHRLSALYELVQFARSELKEEGKGAKAKPVMM